MNDRANWATIADRIRRGTNPVEVAGYGYESTHKGYLAWLLNSGHWTGAQEAMARLLRAADWPESERPQVERFVSALLPPFWCWTEKKVGAAKSDLLLASGTNGTGPKLAIELKVDSPPGSKQFPKMSEGLGKEADLGLALLLGTSAIRDDYLHCGGYGRFGTLTALAILQTWEGLALPAPGQAWCEALTHEQQRLEGAYTLPGALQSVWWNAGYRSLRHMMYAKLHAVRGALEATAICKPWHLYDGGFNTVLCLHGDSRRSWLPVAKNVLAFWEWNDDRLVLKVEAKDGQSREMARRWLTAFQRRAGQVNCGVPQKTLPRAAHSGSTWISVQSWAPRFENPRVAADDAVAVIEAFEPLVHETVIAE
ncbi:MAG: hypothetical protein FJ125_17440 [Deltaproteobacteria bacterium]|nr:hypothetical protein [Deltaproteobacteria bacterium]